MKIAKKRRNQKKSEIKVNDQKRLKRRPTECCSPAKSSENEGEDDRASDVLAQLLVLLLNRFAVHSPSGRDVRVSDRAVHSKHYYDLRQSNHSEKDTEPRHDLPLVTGPVVYVSIDRDRVHVVVERAGPSDMSFK